MLARLIRRSAILYGIHVSKVVCQETWKVKQERAHPVFGSSDTNGLLLI